MISEATNKVTATINVGSAPTGVAADPVAGKVYVTNPNYGTVSVIDEVTQMVIATLPVTSSFAVDVDPTTGIAYVTGDSAVSVIQRVLTATGGFTVIGGERSAAADPVATFTDPANLPASAYKATIDWGDGTTSTGTITTTGNGSYKVTGRHVYADDGSYKVTVTITQKSAPGNTGTATSRALVYATGPGGNFTIGGNHAAAGDTTTFWGNTWRKANQVRLGSTPASYRGWEDQPTLPACGATWTTSPYISGPLPAPPLPAYIPVIVTGGFTQLSDGRVTGTTLHIVIVRTSPGYQPNPASPGTGTVIATLC